MLDAPLELSLLGRLVGIRAGVENGVWQRFGPPFAPADLVQRGIAYGSEYIGFQITGPRIATQQLVECVVNGIFRARRRARDDKRTGEQLLPAFAVKILQLVRVCPCDRLPSRSVFGQSLIMTHDRGSFMQRREKIDGLRPRPSRRL